MMGIQDMPMQDERDYEAENALETLISADKISQDEKLMSRVGAAADRKAEDARRVAREYGTESTPAKSHLDKDREGRVRF